MKKAHIILIFTFLCKAETLLSTQSMQRKIVFIFCFIILISYSLIIFSYHYLHLKIIILWNLFIQKKKKTDMAIQCHQENYHVSYQLTGWCWDWCLVLLSPEPSPSSYSPNTTIYHRTKTKAILWVITLLELTF